MTTPLDRNTSAYQHLLVILSNLSGTCQGSSGGLAQLPRGRRYPLEGMGEKLGATPVLHTRTCRMSRLYGLRVLACEAIRGRAESGGAKNRPVKAWTLSSPNARLVPAMGHMHRSQERRSRACPPTLRSLGQVRRGRVLGTATAAALEGTRRTSEVLPERR